jgi:hypothetical protein
MKRNVIGILSLVVMSLILNTTGAVAQAVAKANVPFAFTVGSAQLPAGTYMVSALSDTAIVIQNSQTRAAAASITRREYACNCSPKLVFHRLGDQYFLAEVWKGAGGGMVIPRSKLEKSLEKELQLASRRANVGEEVMVALN